jgi:tRNA(His) 5'-end guanylyltransferase
MNDDLGDRQKEYENIEADRKFIPTLPVMARIDGKCFSSFTKGMQRPFDPNMSGLMVETTKKLVEETNARCGYTQSDEISLVWHEHDYKSQIFFNGRVQKMCSVLASMATLYFNNELPNFFYHNCDVLLNKFPMFDCRVWQLPTRTEAVNCFVWREQDATKNSISMAARHYYSHNELMNKNGKEMQEMLFQKGVNWNDYPVFFKRGTYIQKKTVIRKFTTGELGKLPPMHEARKNPDLVIERSEIKTIQLPVLTTIQNRIDVILNGADPIVADKIVMGNQNE